MNINFTSNPEWEKAEFELCALISVSDKKHYLLLIKTDPPLLDFEEWDCDKEPIKIGEHSLTGKYRLIRQYDRYKHANDQYVRIPRYLAMPPVIQTSHAPIKP